jgi:magnesium transporter
MEKTAISFINQISRTPFKQNGTSEMLADMPAAVAREVLRGLKRGNGEDVEVLPQYSEDSAGSIMDPKVLTIGRTATVAEAIGMVRSAELDEDARNIFVIDDQGRYVGDVRIHRLLTRPEQACIDALVDPDAMFVRVDTNRDRVQELFEQHDLVTVPVLNNDDQPVGRITSDRANGDTADERRSL